MRGYGPGETHFECPVQIGRGTSGELGDACADLGNGVRVASAHLGQSQLVRQ